MAGQSLDLVKTDVFDDDSVVIRQIHLHPNDCAKRIYFGPLHATLAQLYNDGFTLVMYTSKLGMVYPRKVNVYLESPPNLNRVRYKVCRITVNSIQRGSTPASYVRDRIDLTYKRNQGTGGTLEAQSPKQSLAPAIIKDQSPVDYILSKYANQSILTESGMVGNKPTTVWLRDQLNMARETGRL